MTPEKEESSSLSDDLKFVVAGIAFWLFPVAVGALLLALLF